MSYRHDTFSMPLEHSAVPGPVYFNHHAQYPTFMQHHQPGAEMMIPPYAFSEYGGFVQPGMMLDEFDESAEISTRPRLTKEQVEILESQFRAHPKPNSMVKKQLAMQTKLTLPRVANWFQNRRAKAKQLKKQEEYENQQGLDVASDQHSDGGDNQADERPKTEGGQIPASPTNASTDKISETSQSTTTPAAQSPTKTDLVRESWLSLQRALGAVKAGHPHRAQEQDLISMPPPDIPRPIPISHSQHSLLSSQPLALMSPAEWSIPESSAATWPASPPVPNHLGFDFGFDQEPFHVIHEQVTPIKEHFVASSVEWPSHYVNDPQLPASSHYTDLMSPPIMPAAHPQSARRGSGSEELAANFGTFALAGTPPMPIPQMSIPVGGGTDIASRRKRPRPAALTSASLRSRSYGALSSTSPSFRNGPPSGGQLRQVKSTGFGLNSHYAGIRKSSIPQKSPLNISTFAEAEALNDLMAQRTASTSASKTPTPADQAGQGNVVDMPNVGFSELGQLQRTPSEIVAQYKQLSSPPVTPFQSDFMMQHSVGVQSAVHNAQYASLADYTPPYSAGPLTNSTCSWSDAPLQSPDLPNFPTGTFMSSLGFNQQETAFQQWVLPSDSHPDPGAQRKTEFYITEFPGQREEHASVAQQVVPQRPKNYVFANTAPCDYDL